MNKILIKPLSVNQCWQGKRFKTSTYKDFEQSLLLLLPHLEMQKKKDLGLYIEVGYSNKNADLDNFLKPFLDCLQKKYGFNDNQIYEIQLVKNIVKRKEEYIAFDIFILQNN